MKSKSSKISIFSIGNELLNGRVVDTNSQFIAQYFSDLGFEVIRTCSARDEINEICHELRHLISISQVVIITGGLGPTSDDLTRDAIAAEAEAPLELNSDCLSKLEEFAKARGRELRENNKRQAYIPKGAEVFCNEIGTADGFAVEAKSTSNSCAIIALPGVPEEMRRLVKGPVSDFLLARHKDLKPPVLRSFSVFGLSESFIGQTLDRLELPAGIEIAYRPSFPIVKVYFFGISATEFEVVQVFDMAVKALSEEFIFSMDTEQSLFSVVSQRINSLGKTLAVAESCTGGRIADSFISIPGASNFFRAGLITYANQAKETFVGVHSSVLAENGAVSEKVAIDMARGAMIKSGSDFAISTTGIAGPEGGSQDKPLGSVWIGLATRNEVKAYSFHYPLEREMFREIVAHRAVDLLRREIFGLSLSSGEKG